MSTLDDIRERALPIHDGRHMLCDRDRRELLRRLDLAFTYMNHTKNCFEQRDDDCVCGLEAGRREIES